MAKYTTNGIVETNLSKSAISLEKTEYTYDGKAKRPAICGYASSLDYTVKYPKNCKKIGTYKVTITGKGIGKGKIERYFKIVSKGTTIKKLKSSKKGFAISWKAQLKKMPTKTINGYEVCYGLKKDFSGKKSIKRVAGAKKTTLNVSRLSTKATYYVQIRTYMVKNGKTCYSPWSTTKSVKVK